jgi:hypothetical protein
MKIQVSPEDADLLSLRFYAHPAGYVSHAIDGKTQLMHRLVAERVIGRPLKRNEWVDHLNHDKCDNRRENLRVVPPSGNGFNRKGAQINSISGERNVSYDSTRDKWFAVVTYGGKDYLRKRYDTKAEAIAAASAVRAVVEQFHYDANADTAAEL